MTTYDRDQPPREAATAAPLVRTLNAPAENAARYVTRLQRTIGNRAVAGLLSTKLARTAKTPPPAAPEPPEDVRPIIAEIDGAIQDELEKGVEVVKQETGSPPPDVEETRPTLTGSRPDVVRTNTARRLERIRRSLQDVAARKSAAGVPTATATEAQRILADLDRLAETRRQLIAQGVPDPFERARDLIQRVTGERLASGKNDRDTRNKVRRGLQHIRRRVRPQAEGGGPIPEAADAEWLLAEVNRFEELNATLEKLRTTKSRKQAPWGVKTPRTTPSGAGGSRVSEARGGGVKPIQVPEPALAGASAKAVREARAIALVSMQLNKMRAQEMQKAIAALERLGPEIDRYRQEGNDVIVTLRVEIPDKVDIAAIWAGIGDVTQVVYFSEMLISAVLPRRPKSKSDDPLIRGTPDKGPQHQMHGRGDKGVAVRPWYLEHPTHKDFHFDTGDLVLEGVDLPREDLGPRTRYRTTAVRSIESGSKDDVTLNGLHRTWVWGPSGGIFDDDAPQDPWMLAKATDLADLVKGGDRLRMERGAGPVEVITSTFRVERPKSGAAPVLVESAEGKPRGHKGDYLWKAEIVWTKVD